MKSKNLLGLLGIVSMSLLFSCSSPYSNVQSIELQSYSKEMKEVDDEIFMKFPYRVGLGDGVLFAFDLVSDSLFYHVYKYPELEYLYSLGQKGNGPGEITLSTPFQLCGNNLAILEGSRSELYFYRCVADSLPVLLRSVKLGLPRSIDFAVVNDSVSLVEDLSGISRFTRVSPEGKEALYSIPASTNDGKPAAELGYLWRSFMAYDPETDKLAMATQFGEVLEIYSLDGSAPVIVRGEEGDPRQSGRIEGFQDVHWVNGEIYALYSGRSQDERLRKSSMGQREDGGDKIRVYDTNGVWLREYKLDFCINGFTFDEKNNRIIGITSNRDNPFLFFDLDTGKLES